MEIHSRMTYFNFPQTIIIWYIFIFKFENIPALTLSLETTHVTKSIQFVFLNKLFSGYGSKYRNEVNRTD